MTPFVRHAALMFLALRAGDLVNLAAGMWLVPKYVAPEELGAVLPVTTFATLLAIPLFAFAMAVMKESSDLAGRGERGKLKSLWRGVFVAIAALAALSLAATAALLPHYLKAMRVADAAAGFFILAAALLGSLAPVYTDALQSVRRFKSLAALEFSAAVLRMAALAVTMPIRAFAGYFAGNAVQPLTRICGSVLLLRGELRVPPERFWTREATVRLTTRFLLILLYLATAMRCANVELDLLRKLLPAADSAGYYLASRLSDVLNYLTLPLMLVMFPYAAESAREGRSTLPLVLRGCLATLIAALLLGGVYALWGGRILALLPHGAENLQYLTHLPTLLAISALTACQTIYTNAEVASGRFRFLWWFVPTNLAYLALLSQRFDESTTATLGGLLTWFLLAATMRAICCAVQELWRHRSVRQQ